MIDDLQLFRVLAVPLSRPNATYTSILQVAKRVRVADDRIRRSLSRLEERIGTRLVVTQGRKLVLTSAGSHLADLAGQIDALREGTFADDGLEPFVIDADPLLAETLLPLVLGDFFSVYADTVKVEVCRFDAVTSPERLDNGSAHLGIAWADGDSNTSVEVIDLPVPWVVALPMDHSFAKREVLEGGLAQFDRVFISADERSLATTASVLGSVASGRRVELPSVAAVLAAVHAGAGVGVVPNVLWRATPTLRTVPIAGIEPDRVAIFLPRRGGDLTDAADSLRTILKRVAIEPYPLSSPHMELPLAEERLPDASDAPSA